MSFLNWPTEEVLPSRRSQQNRRRVLSDLFTKFRRAFPEVIYELLWESPTINAQAWRLGSARFVYLYGGLVRHQVVGKAGLAMALAHETGHHLGGPPIDPDLRWMAWQGQADYWAASVAMPRVFGAQARRMTLRGAREILKLHRQFGCDAPDLSPECRLRIFCAGASNDELPDCAKAEYQECFNRPYPKV
jgi:Peptidase family M48